MNGVCQDKNDGGGDGMSGRGSRPLKGTDEDMLR
jgi:hypothetical protein